MSKKTLQRYRALVAMKGMTIKKVAELSGISISTLSDMKSEDWAQRTIDNIEKLEAALPSIEALVTEPEQAPCP